MAQWDDLQWLVLLAAILSCAGSAASDDCFVALECKDIRFEFAYSDHGLNHNIQKGETANIVARDQSNVELIFRAGGTLVEDLNEELTQAFLHDNGYPSTAIRSDGAKWLPLGGCDKHEYTSLNDDDPESGFRLRNEINGSYIISIDFTCCIDGPCAGLNDTLQNPVIMSSNCSEPGICMTIPTIYACPCSVRARSAAETAHCNLDSSVTTGECSDDSLPISIGFILVAAFCCTIAVYWIIGTAVDFGRNGEVSFPPQQHFWVYLWGLIKDGFRFSFCVRSDSTYEPLN